MLQNAHFRRHIGRMSIRELINHASTLFKNVYDSQMGRFDVSLLDTLNWKI